MNNYSITIAYDGTDLTITQQVDAHSPSTTKAVSSVEVTAGVRGYRLVQNSVPWLIDQAHIGEQVQVPEEVEKGSLDEVSRAYL